MIYGNIVLLMKLLTRGAVCQISLSLLTLVSRLEIDCITSGKAKILCKPLPTWISVLRCVSGFHYSDSRISTKRQSVTGK